MRVVHYFTCTSSVYRGIGWKKHENYKPQTEKSLFLASDLKLQKTILSKVKAEQSHEMWLNSSFPLFRIKCEVSFRYHRGQTSKLLFLFFIARISFTS